MEKTILGKNSYGWKLLRLTSFLVIPVLAAVAVFFDLILMLFTDSFLPVFSVLSIFYGLYRTLSGKQYIHKPVKGNDIAYLKLDEVSEALIYKAFAVIAPVNYELNIYRTLGTTDDAIISVDTKDKVASVYLREEEYLVLKCSDEESAYLLPELVKRAYSYFKQASIISTVHFDSILESINKAGEKQVRKMEEDNSARVGFLLGGIAGGAGGAAIGSIAGAGTKTVSGAPVAILGLFAIGGFLYMFAVILFIWIFQLPYNQIIRSTLRSEIYEPFFKNLDSKGVRKIKNRAKDRPRIVSNKDEEYSPELGWSPVI